MSKSKVRKIHIDDTEWVYAISKGEVRIYEPGTKQIKVRIDQKFVRPDPEELKEAYAEDFSTSCETEDEYLRVMGSVQPRLVKKYIEENLIVSGGENS